MRQRLVGLIAALFLCLVPLPGMVAAEVRLATSRPNFVVIVVDDLDSNSFQSMNAVDRWLVRDGLSFSRFFATTPLCCPSRASLLRGQYAHNHGVLRNTGNDAGFSAFYEAGLERSTMATLLDGAGYETALIGKYLNGYSLSGDGRHYVPPGWDYWVAGTDHHAYDNYNYELNINGDLTQFGDRDSDYLTDVLTGEALRFLDGASRSVQPFFLYLAPYAPHSPATPAPRHAGLFDGAAAPRGPAFNERNVRDKPRWVRQTARISEPRNERIDEDYARRMEALQGVDEMIDGVLQRLDDVGELENTYVVFLSDNGYFLGQHRQPHGKDAPYDAASRVPMVIRGPRIAGGSTNGSLALNIDVLPTMLSIAGINVPAFVDGRSLEPLWQGNDRDWRRSALIEGFGKESEANQADEEATPAFRALRTEQTLYVEYATGERELYDLRRDPHQLASLDRKASNDLRRIFARRLAALSRCSGSACQEVEDEPLASRARDVEKTRRASEKAHHHDNRDRARHGRR